MSTFRIFVGFFLVLFLAFFSGGFYLGSLTNGVDSQEKSFLLVPGESVGRVAVRLELEGFIPSERIFRWYLKLNRTNAGLKVGEYSLRPNMTIAEIVRIITSGKSILHKFVVPEGNNKFQIAEQLEKQGLGRKENFLRAVESPKLIQDFVLSHFQKYSIQLRSLEGYLYPDTYMISKLMTEEDIVRLLLKRFKEMYQELEEPLEKQAQAWNLTPHQLLILASIVEKETGAGKERPLIASVFYNRIQKKMRLQSDPTTIYGMWDRDKKFSGNIRRADLLTKTNYNTYTLDHLPMGPIANPGRSAFHAVINPASSDYLYFVSRNDGTHVFTTKYSEHQKAVSVLQRTPSMRTGKSWRDLPVEDRAKNSGVDK